MDYEIDLVFTVSPDTRKWREPEVRMFGDHLGYPMDIYILNF
jgi:hypothetical protein